MTIRSQRTRIHGHATSSSLCVGRPRFNTSDGYWTSLASRAATQVEAVQRPVGRGNGYRNAIHTRPLQLSITKELFWRWRGARRWLEDKIVDKFEGIGVWAEEKVLHAWKNGAPQFRMQVHVTATRATNDGTASLFSSWWSTILKTCWCVRLTKETRVNTAKWKMGV